MPKVMTFKVNIKVKTKKLGEKIPFETYNWIFGSQFDHDANNIDQGLCGSYGPT